VILKRQAAKTSVAGGCLEPPVSSHFKAGKQDHWRAMTYACGTRSGFTLLEVMLVLGVLAVLAGMTVPSVMRMFGQQKLTASAERVRSAIASTRFRAIESGIIYQFCCETNGSRYVVVPFEPDHVNSQAGGQAGGGLLSRAAGRLPAGVVFSSVNFRSTIAPSVTPATAGSSHKLMPGALDGLPNAGDLAGANWSTPVLFHPDGSANADLEITVSDPKMQHIKLRVRAFTGAVSIERLVAGKR
jgi:prepilin-type N-terminal cleavage/methylation domain-containing protein